MTLSVGRSQQWRQSWFQSGRLGEETRSIKLCKEQKGTFSKIIQDNTAWKISKINVKPTNTNVQHLLHKHDGHCHSGHDCFVLCLIQSGVNCTTFHSFLRPLTSSTVVSTTHSYTITVLVKETQAWIVNPARARPICVHQTDCTLGPTASGPGALVQKHL